MKQGTFGNYIKTNAIVLDPVDGIEPPLIGHRVWALADDVNQERDGMDNVWPLQFKFPVDPACRRSHSNRAAIPDATSWRWFYCR